MDNVSTGIPQDDARLRSARFAGAPRGGGLAGSARRSISAGIDDAVRGLVDRIIDRLAGGSSRFARFEAWLAARRPVSLPVSASPRYAGLDRPACLRRAARRRDG